MPAASHWYAVHLSIAQVEQKSQTKKRGGEPQNASSVWWHRIYTSQNHAMKISVQEAGEPAKPLKINRLYENSR